MMQHEVVCNDCGCLLPISEEIRKKYPHRCWVKEVGTRRTYLPSNLPDSDNPEDDPFYEWPEPT